MRSPRDTAQKRKVKGPALPRGGKAAARAREFALERGLDLEQSKTGGGPPSRRKNSTKTRKK
jgi:hypothetical protein